MLRSIEWTSTIVLSVLINLSEGDSYSNLDKKCKDVQDCYADATYPGVVACRNGFCDCNYPKYIRHVNGFLDRTEVTCSSITPHYLSLPFPFIKAEHFVCESRIGRETYCKCKEGIYITFMSRSACATENIVGFGELCRQFTNRCNQTLDLECSGNKCLCPEEKMYNFTTSKCEPKKDYLDLYGIKEYRVTHGVYCATKSDCISGLECCANQTCSCPSICRYDKEKQACDCGEHPTAVGAIVCGILSGFVIVICWCCMISRTFKRHGKERRNSLVSTDFDVPQPSAPASTSVPPLHDAPLLHDGVDRGLHNVRSQERDPFRFSTPVPSHTNAEQAQPPPYYSLPDISPPAYEDCVRTPLSRADNRRTSDC